MPHSRPSPLTDALRRHGFALSALLLAAVGAFMVFAALRLGEDHRWVDHTHRVIGLLDEVRLRLEGSGLQARNYLLTRSPTDLMAFQASETALGAVASRLEEQVADNPPQRARARRLREVLGQRQALLVTHFAASRLAPAALLPRLTALRGRSDPLVAEMRKVEEGLLVARDARSRQTLSTLLGAALLAIPFSLLVLGYGQGRLAAENRRRAAAEAELHTSLAQLQAVSTDLEALSSFSGMLQSTTSMEELFALCARTFPRLLPGTAGSVFLIKASRDYAEAVAHWGEHVVPTETLPMPTACWSIRRQRPHAVADVHGGLPCAHCRVEGAVQGATACIPLGGQGETYGWLYLSAQAPIGSGELQLAINACEQLSLALGNARLRDALRHQSVRDALTGLYNRRYLEEGLAREVSRCQRRHLPLSVLMLDLDHFKTYNDTHGHPGGDVVLAQVGKLLEASCRGEDIPCRYGGEEFALVLPEASGPVAMMRAEQIRKALRGQTFMHAGRELEGVTVSVGVAALPANGNSAQELLQAADAALYRAKQAGRDRVESA